MRYFARISPNRRMAFILALLFALALIVLLVAVMNPPHTGLRILGP